jgi:predicted transcriptional regulator of viral defense system
MSTTDWQQHSVRGFLAGVVRKKLRLNLVSELTDKGRIYRIKEGNAASTGASRAKQAA